MRGARRSISPTPWERKLAANAEWSEARDVAEAARQAALNKKKGRGKGKK